jgi:hypothetical protein
LKNKRGFLSYNEFLRRWHDEDANGKKFERYGIAIWRNSPPKDSDKKSKGQVIESTEIK